MNIQSINNQTSFKRVYFIKEANFTESQLRVIEDINSKVDKKSDYFVKPLANDVVELSEIYNAKEVGTGVDKRFTYKDPLIIGRYDEKHPFELKDVKYAVKQSNIHAWAFSLACLGFIASILVIPLAQKCKPEPNPTVKEHVINPIKDSLQKVGKDTLDLTKQLMKK